MSDLLYRGYRRGLFQLQGKITVPHSATSDIICSISDLVQRFQEASSSHLADAVEELPVERPRSSASARRSAHRTHEREVSDSDHGHQARPRLRRGRTEQPPIRHREAFKLGLLSDGDRSYAANASRIPSSFIKRSLGDLPETQQTSSRLKSPSRPPARLLLSGRNSPSPPSKLAPPASFTMGRSAAVDVKPRMGGRGKASRQSEISSGRTSPGLLKSSSRRTLAGSSRVTSIARHFDRLSRDAERERQKRMSLVRGKRARPVGVTKAKVQVFNNLRDAVKDESDSDSSGADNEEDDQGSDDSADSAGKPKASRKPRSPLNPRKSSPTYIDSAVLPGKPSPSVLMVSAASSDNVSSTATDDISVSASASSLASTSVLSDARSEMSFTDRLQIELPSFATSAPLPSVPVTPQLSTDTAEEGYPALSHMSHMSESELSSGGGERSSIIRTLTGLWAFRAGDFTPLEYPL